MTHDFAKPSTTRPSSARSSTPKTPGKRSNERPSPRKPKNQKTSHKNVSKKAPEPQSKMRPLVIFASSVVAIAFIASLYFLNKVPPSSSVLTEPSSSTQTKTKKKAEPTAKTEERFNFYDILKESEVVPPKVEEYKYTEKGKPTKYQYILQTGSFRSLKDAERQRATIGFQGLKGKIEKTSNKGNTWYRVQVGPFYSRSKMNGAMDKLVAINLQPLVRQNKR